jgi:hypothetical protein
LIRITTGGAADGPPLHEAGMVAAPGCEKVPAAAAYAVSPGTLAKEDLVASLKGCSGADGMNLPAREAIRRNHN